MSSDSFDCALRELKQYRRRSMAVIAGYTITVSFLLIVAAVMLYSRVVQNITIGEAGTYFVTWLPSCGDISSLSEEDLAKLARGIIPQVCKDKCENCTGCNKKPVDLLNEGFVINTNTTRLVSTDLVAKIAGLATIKDASPCLLFRFRDPTTSLIFAVAGILPDSVAVSSTICNSIDLTSGNYLPASATGKVLVDTGFASNHGLEPGHQVTIAEEKFEIAGIVNTRARTVRSDIFMHFSDAERVINRRIQNPLEREANLILIESRDAAVHNQAIKDVKELMKGDSVLTSGCYYPAANALGLNTRLIWVFMIVIAISTVLFAARIQFASVIERRRGIAMLRVLGWKTRTIIIQLLFESLIQSTAGSLMGIIAGSLVLLLVPVNQLLGIDATMTGVFSASLCLAVFLFAVIAGTLAGLLPGILIVRQRPYDVLRRS